MTGTSTDPPTPSPYLIFWEAAPVTVIEPVTHETGKQLSTLSLKNRWTPKTS
jgi:hypothetical protein